MMQDATFGQGPTFNTDVGFSFDLSDDRKAFTATFSGLEAVVDGDSASPIATRVFSFSLPANSNTSFVQPHKYTAGDAADVRVTVFLLANRDSKSDSGVHVIVNTIDTDMVKHES